MAGSHSMQPFFMICCSLWISHVAAADYTIDCRKPPAGSMETLVCKDSALMALDREMAGLYAAALKKAGNEHPPLLKAEQRGWIKGRNDCWKADDKRHCVVETYRRRKIELQTRYRLVSATAPVHFVCNDNPADEVLATYFLTDPPSLVAERGDQTSLMVAEPSASGAKYVGRNESLWEHQGEAMIVWGYGAAEMRCRRAEAPAATTLAGSAWRLVAIQSMDDEQGTRRIVNPERYTLNFEADGRARFRIDCNRGAATWKAEPSVNLSSGSLEFGALAMTHATCSPDSHDQRILRDLPHVRSYLRKDGRLFMSMMADGGIYEWAPLEP